MRQTIGTAPRNQETVIIEDEDGEAFDFARWSPELGHWVTENGERSDITPTHWRPVSLDQHVLKDGESALDKDQALFDFLIAQTFSENELSMPKVIQRRWKSIAFAIIAIGAIWFFSFDFDDFVAVKRNIDVHESNRSTGEKFFSQANDPPSQPVKTSDVATAELQQERNKTAALTSELATVRRNFEATAASSTRANDDATLMAKTAEAAMAELQQERQKTAALTGELATVRFNFEATSASSTKANDEAMPLAKTAEAATVELQQERQKTAALAGELATIRRNFEATAASSTKANDEAIRLAKTAEAATAELQQERQKTAALTSELAILRRNSEATAASSTKAGDEAMRLAKTAEAAKADLQQKRKKTAVISLRADEAHPEVDAAISPDQTENSWNIPAKSTIMPTMSKQLTPSGSAADLEAVRLMTRATGLLSQGNISEARIVLERAVEMGSAKASFAIAETYDPRVLSGWKTFGTRGDQSKAREFYAKAAAGGIVEANDRLGSLSQ